ncbi:MAG: hypothetical protein HY539_04805, partial [Deltaproteobacteria bacterium]|nr:hypothetical protein [Deltaproteobacteria bacterium]
VTPGSGAGSEICGDALCNGSESPTNCPSDCGSVAGGGGYCGDGTCQAARGETTGTCASDCSSQQQQQQSVNLPSSFSVLRGNSSTDNCEIVDSPEAGGTSTTTISSQTASGFTASLPISTPMLTSLGGDLEATDTTTGTGSKTASTWSVTTSRTDANLNEGTCTLTFSQILQGNLSPFSCTSVTETWTVVSGNCNGEMGMGVSSCTVTYGSASCSP